MGLDIANIASLIALVISAITAYWHFVVEKRQVEVEESKATSAGSLNKADAADTITDASVKVVQMLQQRAEDQDQEIDSLRKEVAELTTKLEAAQARIALLEQLCEEHGLRIEEKA